MLSPTLFIIKKWVRKRQTDTTDSKLHTCTLRSKRSATSGHPPKRKTQQTLKQAENRTKAKIIIIFVVQCSVRAVQSPCRVCNHHCVWVWDSQNHSKDALSLSFFFLSLFLITQFTHIHHASSLYILQFIPHLSFFLPIVNIAILQKKTRLYTKHRKTAPHQNPAVFISRVNKHKFARKINKK